MSTDMPRHLDRRDFLKLAALSSTLSLWPRRSFGADRAGRPFNIIFMMGDDFSTSELGCYGAAEYETPNIDALARGGVRFETCWATPLCNPSRVELLTGRYGFRTRFYHNWMTPPEPVIGKNRVYPRMLQEAGLKTAMAGKWHHMGPPWDYGFDESCVSWGANNGWVPEDFPQKPGYHFWQPCILKNRKYLPTGPDDYGPDICADFLIDFMIRNKEHPFYAYFTPVLAHSPHYPTPDSLQPGMDRLQSGFDPHFKSNVEYADKLVGRIVDAVDKLGLRERTIIIFTTDNGTPPAKAHAVEEGCRVPLIVNCPGILKLSGTCGELIDFSDMLPTFVDLAGAKPSQDYVIDGHSFAPLLLGEPYERREWIFSYCGAERLLRDKRWLYEAGGRFFDCGNNRDGDGYKEVTNSTDPEAMAAFNRFAEILTTLPPPATDDPLFEMYREMERDFIKMQPNYSLVWFNGMKRPPMILSAPEK